MGSEVYVLFVVAAALSLFLAATRVLALRRYRDLLDPHAPQASSGGSVRGVRADRRTQIGLIGPARGVRQYPKVQITIETSVPLRIEAYSQSLAIVARKVLGVVEDRSLGLEDLDRRFALQFDDRARTRAILERPEAGGSLLALADLGAEFVLLTNGTLTVEIPVKFVIFPSRDRIQSVLETMFTFASSGESALGTPRPAAPSGDTELAPLESWPAAQPSGSVISWPIHLATLFIAMTLAIWILGSFWDFNGRVPWRTRLLTVSERLPGVALLAGAGALLAALLLPKRPLRLAFQVSWPLVFHAGLVGLVYVVLRMSGVPELREALGKELEMIPEGLKTAGAAAGVALGSGFAGAIVGKRLSGH